MHHHIGTFYFRVPALVRLLHGFKPQMSMQRETRESLITLFKARTTSSLLIMLQASSPHPEHLTARLTQKSTRYSLIKYSLFVSPFRATLV